jgi:hypothetical protein
MMTGPGRAAPKTHTPSTHIGHTPAQHGTAAAKGAKAKETGGTAASRTDARRDLHSDQPVAMPAGQRERGSGGNGFQGDKDGRMEMHEWMPVSAQQSRVTRSIAPHIAMTRGAHAFQHAGLRTTVMSMFGRLYMEVLPSLFRHTPQEIDRSKRDIKKDLLNNTQEKHLTRSESRRDGHMEIQGRPVKMEPKRAMAGDLSTAFAGT